jgi:hypothetical protein
MAWCAPTMRGFPHYERQIVNPTTPTCPVRSFCFPVCNSEPNGRHWLGGGPALNTAFVLYDHALHREQTLTAS